MLPTSRCSCHEMVIILFFYRDYLLREVLFRDYSGLGGEVVLIRYNFIANILLCMSMFCIYVCRPHSLHCKFDLCVYKHFGSLVSCI